MLGLGVGSSALAHIAAPASPMVLLLQQQRPHACASQVAGKGSRLVLKDTTCRLEVGDTGIGLALLHVHRGAQVTLDRAALTLQASPMGSGPASNTGAASTAAAGSGSRSSVPSRAGGSSGSSRQGRARGIRGGPTVSGQQEQDQTRRVHVVNAQESKFFAKDSQVTSELPEGLAAATLPSADLLGSNGVLQGCKFRGVYITILDVRNKHSLPQPSALHARVCDFKIADSVDQPGLRVCGGSKASLSGCSISTAVQVCGQLCKRPCHCICRHIHLTSPLLFFYGDITAFSALSLMLACTGGQWGPARVRWLHDCVSLQGPCGCVLQRQQSSAHPLRHQGGWHKGGDVHVNCPLTLRVYMQNVGQRSNYKGSMGGPSFTALA